MRIGFDNEKYLTTQSEHIRERIAKFGGKLYLEFGGKLFDDYHASRVLPGFEPDSKITMLCELKEQAEIVVAINAADIEKNKVRGDLGITYDEDLLRLVDAFTSHGLYVGSVVLTRFANQPSAVAYEKKLQSLGLKVYRHYPIEGYPVDIHHSVGPDCTMLFAQDNYDIPYRCLVPVGLHNLLVSGRCAGYTHEAMASARVMSTCMAVGQAAGTVARLALLQGVEPSKVDVGSVREELLRQGAYLGE